MDSTPPIAIVPHAPGPGRVSENRRVARAFEESLAGELARAARPRMRQDGPFGGGFGASAFESFLDDELGKALSRNGRGIGVAADVERQLNRRTSPRSP